MNPIISLLIAWIVTTISLLIISKLPLGVEIDTFKKALISAAVFGIINGLLQLVFFLPNFLTFGLFSFIVNIIAFGIAAKLVVGFRLTWGIWSAVIGALALSVINSVIFHLIARL